MIKIAYHPIYVHPLEVGHRFPMDKYALIYGQLLYEGTFNESNFFQPNQISNDSLELAHSKEYILGCENGNIDIRKWKKVGFPWSSELVRREKIIMDGSIQAAKFALKNGCAFNIAGGTHHAYSDSGEGFCIFNDCAITSLYLTKVLGIKQVLIIDLDVHQGNGTAKILADDDQIFTFSMHGQSNYPSPKEKSDWDIGLKDGTNNEEYLNHLVEAIDYFEQYVKPNFVIYQSGVDILDSDKLGKLSISLEGCKKRDKLVIDYCFRNNIPLMSCLGGGYSTDIKTITEAHCNLFRLAKKYYD